MAQRVSCIMPTCDRASFIPCAIAYFLRKSLQDSELIIVDDGHAPIGGLVPADPRIRYVRLDARRPVGAKRNLACELARSELIAHWDDDDWYAPDRLQRQAVALDASDALIFGSPTYMGGSVAQFMATFALKLQQARQTPAFAGTRA